MVNVATGFVTEFVYVYKNVWGRFGKHLINGMSSNENVARSSVSPLVISPDCDVPSPPDDSVLTLMATDVS